MRYKDIVYSSRTRAATDQHKRIQKLRIAIANLLKEIPDEFRNSEHAKMLQQEADKRYIQLSSSFIVPEATRGIGGIFSFPDRMIEERWESGYDDARRTLAEPEVMRRFPRNPIEGVRIFDVCKDVSNSVDLKP